MLLVAILFFSLFNWLGSLQARGQESSKFPLKLKNATRS